MFCGFVVKIFQSIVIFCQEINFFSVMSSKIGGAIFWSFAIDLIKNIFRFTFHASVKFRGGYRSSLHTCI